MLFLAFGLCAFSACTKQPDELLAEPLPEPDVVDASEEQEPEEEDNYWCNEFDVMALEGMEYGSDYESLYDHCGKDITITDIIEDPETGLAYIDVDGVQCALGLDFLSKAMVYNDNPAGEYATEEDVYAAWWKYYITRWNMILPEIPLYTNEYYDLYNTKIGNVQENPTNPYWDPADALIDWTSEKDEQNIIIGNSSNLSGHFRYASYGKNTSSAADRDIENLINGLETVSRNKEGGYQWNETAVECHEEAINEDGSKTFTIKIYEDLVYSDGTPITARDYLVFPMVFFSPVATQASGHQLDGSVYTGYEDFNAYTGADSPEGIREMKGFRLLDDYTFSVTISAEYIPYFYDITYATFSPNYPAMWLGDAEILDEGEGCFITEGFYEKEEGEYKAAKIINASATDTSDATYAKYPYSGEYCLKNFDTSNLTVTLVRNPNFKGNYEGTIPSIEQIVYKKIVSATSLDDFKAGDLDIISGITGAAKTDEAIKLADESEGTYGYIHYSRAGYGKLGFRADYGPVQFAEVRRALCYCIDRKQFAKDFTGGYGSVVDGPYYTGAWMYKTAIEHGMVLDEYSNSLESAIEALEEGGWVYAADGSDYVEGVRYKKIPGDVITENDKNYQSVDGAYKTIEINGDYYMPLVINWYGMIDTEFTELLKSRFSENEDIEIAGIAVYTMIGEMPAALDELYQESVYGYYGGTPMFNAFNYASAYNSACYDYSHALSIDPLIYNDYSIYFVKDYADIFRLN